MSSLLRRGFLVIAALFVFLRQSAAQADQIFVSITASGFVPNQVTINVGDSILWLNFDSDSVHSTTSDKPVNDPDYWDRSLTYFTTYNRTFVHAGTFNYHDNNSPYTGKIIVNNPTLISLQSPLRINGQFIFSAAGLTSGRTNILSASTNLTQWSAVQTNVASGTSMSFTNSSNAARNFYRLQELQ